MPGNANPSQVVKIKPNKLSEIISIIPEFERDSIFLQTFLNASDNAYMVKNNLKTLYR